MTILASGLLPASFRGAPFAVNDDDLGGGRRIIVHQYFGRDEPNPEDIGRAPRRYRFRGFIVDDDVVFAGGPIQLQRAQLIAAFEKSGAGVLVHPTLGILSVKVMNFSIGQDLGAGTTSSVSVEFIEAGSQSLPSLLSTSSGLLSAANVVTAGLATDGLRAISLAAAAGGNRQDLVTASADWAAQAVALGNDATALQRLTAQLPGNFGRFAGGGNVGINGRAATIYTSATTVAELVSIASAARVSIAAAQTQILNATSLADFGYATSISDAAVALVNALASACADPTEAIRLLEELMDYRSLLPAASTGLGSAFGDMVRRAAAAALTIAAGQYQPTSADDAAAMIMRLGVLLDDQAVEAADGGDTASYKALRAARAAIVTDLRARGSTLAQITTVRSGQALPALVLAQRLYRDSSRAPQLVMQADCPSPLFMPTTFQALAA